MAEPRCASCKHFDLGYNDNGHMTIGFCNFVLPILIRPPQATAPYLAPNDSCSLHSRAIPIDIASREAWWPMIVKQYIEPA